MSARTLAQAARVAASISATPAPPSMNIARVCGLGDSGPPSLPHRCRFRASASSCLDISNNYYRTELFYPLMRVGAAGLAPATRWEYFRATTSRPVNRKRGLPRRGKQHSHPPRSKSHRQACAPTGVYTPAATVRRTSGRRAGLAGRSWGCPATSRSWRGRWRLTRRGQGSGPPRCGKPGLAEPEVRLDDSEVGRGAPGD